MQLWARLVPPVAATPAQPRKLKLLRNKSTQSHFCHCQNLTVPRRARLKLVHPSWRIQHKSLVSWWKKVEHCTQSRTHAMMQTIDYRFELSTVHVADNPLHVEKTQTKNSNFRPYPNSKFEQCVKHVDRNTSHVIFLLHSARVSWCVTPHWLKCLQERVMSSPWSSMMCGWACVFLTLCSSLCSLPYVSPFLALLFPLLPVLCPEPLLPCGQRQGKHILRVRQTRSLAPLAELTPPTKQ